jgi:NADH-ubiquinone oxidoreductase chain 4
MKHRVELVGLFSNTVLGITGGIFLSLAHGLVSPALFMLVGGVLYCEQQMNKQLEP